jgi:hypothetical protein
MAKSEIIHADPPKDHPIWNKLKDLPGYRHEDNVEKRYPRGYIGWSPYGDYLWKEPKGEFAGWDSIIDKSFDELHHEIDEFHKAVTKGEERYTSFFTDCDPDLNLVIDFYFEVENDALRCHACDETGLNPETKKLADAWYSFDDRSKAWYTQLTQDEVDELVRHGRLHDLVPPTRSIEDPELECLHAFFEEDTQRWMGWVKKGDKNEKVQVDPPEIPTAEAVNAWARGRGGGHDAINRHICIEKRARRLGVYGQCKLCGGHGHILQGEPYLVCNIWLAHPRKGASRGIRVHHVPDEGIAILKQFFRTSYKKHTEHFRWALEGQDDTQQPG